MIVVVVVDLPVIIGYFGLAGAVPVQVVVLLLVMLLSLLLVILSLTVLVVVLLPLDVVLEGRFWGGALCQSITGRHL